MSASFDVIIVGAGIVGAACAAECARNGLRVLVVDRGPIGAGTTGAGMGHLVVMDDSEAQLALTAYSLKLWQELAPALPADVEYDPCGTLWLAAEEDEMAEVHRKAERYAAAGVRVEALNGREVAALEPNLREGMAGGLRVPGDAILYPPCAARFLLDEAGRHGAKLRTGIAVRALLEEGGVELADGSKIAADIALTATGPWSPELTPGLPVRKRKGHLVITDRHPGFVHNQVLELGYVRSAHNLDQDSVAFNIQPRKTGQMLIGSSRQCDSEDTVVEQRMLDRMLQRACDYVPALGQLSAIRAWTGHRPTTPDNLPLIGASAKGSRVWLATGHEGLGITTSLGTGRLLTDLLLNRTSEIPAEPYAPTRFASGMTNAE
jgi:D-hydroxyproline dehydrogenase subunit beta